MKNVFIIGAKGYKKNYGGWETFVTNLIDNYNDKSTKFYVSEISDNKNNKIINNVNTECHPIYTKKIGSPTMFIYTIKAFNYFIKYIKNNKIRNAYIYVLGLKLGPFLWLKKHKLNKMGIKVFLNPDGIEWRRSKWNRLIKFCFKLSERSMLYNCDLIICDSKGIKDYIDDTYKNLKVKRIYIAYGANKVIISKNEKSILKKYSIESNNYYLMVGRFVPENNYQLVLKEFMKANTKKQLIIISNIEHNKFYNELLEKTHFDTDKRVIILGPVYNQEELSVIRKNAFAYIHGHSVGGTNPSLLEAMNLTDLNILYNVNFNKEVGLNTCLYFDENNKLHKLINNEKKLINIKNKCGKEAKDRIANNFTWKIICDKYKDIFR